MRMLDSQLKVIPNKMHFLSFPPTCPSYSNPKPKAPPLLGRGVVEMSNSLIDAQYSSNILVLYYDLPSKYYFLFLKTCLHIKPPSS